MTKHTIAATLFGVEDLRVVDTALSALKPNMVRIRFGAGASAARICIISAMRGLEISS